MKLKVVYVAQGQMVAEVIRGKLESAGIPVLLESESVGRLYGLTVAGLGEVQVKVPAALAKDALELLDEASDAEEWAEE